MDSIHVVALVSWSQDRLLVVRKKDHATWFQPGGKPENGETLEEALRREVREELNVEIDELTYLGEFETMAANEANTLLIADMFEGIVSGTPTACAEIDEYRWMSVAELEAEKIAPLIQDFVLPAFGPISRDSR